jgi:type I restriction enzyme S subunit
LLTERGAERGTTIVPAGAILFVVRGMSLAREFRVGLTERAVAFNQDLRGLLPSPEIDANYLVHFLRSSEQDILALVDTASHGTTRLTSDRIEALGVPLPPVAEQRRIAEVLDRAEALRAKRRAALALLDTLTQSIFLDLFGDPVTNEKGWRRCRLADLLSTIDSGWSPNCLDRAAEDDEWGVLKLGAVSRGEYDGQQNKALPPDAVANPNLEIRPGDILFSRKNTYELVGACVLVRDTRAKLMMPDLIFRLVLRSGTIVISDYLQALLSHPRKREQLKKLAGGTSGSMPNISKGRLEGMPIEIPPLPLQQTFARRVAAVEKLKAAQRASLAKLDELFASLQHRAFRGEL